jgi:hypothetical protein
VSRQLLQAPVLCLAAAAADTAGHVLEMVAITHAQLQGAGTQAEAQQQAVADTQLQLQACSDTHRVAAGAGTQAKCSRSKLLQTHNCSSKCCHTGRWCTCARSGGVATMERHSSTGHADDQQHRDTERRSSRGRHSSSTDTYTCAAQPRSSNQHSSWFVADQMAGHSSTFVAWQNLSRT